MTEVEQSIGGDLFWLSSETKIPRPQVIDPKCSPKHKIGLQQLSFANGTIAGLLVHYWSSHLELLMVEDLLQQLPETIKETVVSRNVCQKADETAQLIMEAHPYLSSRFEGIIGLQLPMESVKRYFAQMRS